jgi:hypothetical protein
MPFRIFLPFEWPLKPPLPTLTPELDEYQRLYRVWTGGASEGFHQRRTASRLLDLAALYSAAARRLDDRGHQAPYWKLTTTPNAPVAMKMMPIGRLNHHGGKGLFTNHAHRPVSKPSAT